MKNIVFELVGLKRIECYESQKNTIESISYDNPFVLDHFNKCAQGYGEYGVKINKRPIAKTNIPPAPPRCDDIKIYN
ncbi:hypothetical protein OAU25_02760 [Crocinitomicaceae bacterium]|nr:hypothetical protein [Crocinitomicaceae bacterium]